MKSILRLSFLSLLALAASSVARANWYNHPICTINGVILRWHSTYNDFNGTDFTSSDAPGGLVVPAANLRGITQRSPLLANHVRGGSFAVYNGPSRTSIRGWINVTVQYGADNTTILSYAINYKPNANGFDYPTNNW